MTKAEKQKLYWRKAGIAFLSIAGLGVATAAVVISSRVSGLNKSDFEPGGIRFRWRDVKLGHTNATIKLRVSNSSDLSLPASNAFFQYYFNGTRIAESRWDQAQSILPRQTSVLDIPVRISHLGLGQAAGSVLSKLIAGQPITLANILMTGKVDVNGAPIPLDYVVDLLNEEAEE